MGKYRLEAFSDAVLAIIITIMVLEMKVPHGSDLSALTPILPMFMSYLLSFVYLAIYWNNHHHMLQATKHVTGAILWANLHLLFWLSLFPFVTAWIGDNPLARGPMALYGLALFMAAAAYFILQHTIIVSQGPGSILAGAVGRDLKGKLSLGLYGTAILLAYVEPLLAGIIYIAVALMWLVPDRRIEKVLAESER